MPKIKIDNIELKYTQSHRILGLILDASKLKRKKHIQNLKEEMLNRINIMKKLASLNWGAKWEYLLEFYKIYIRPKRFIEQQKIQDLKIRNPTKSNTRNSN